MRYRPFLSSALTMTLLASGCAGSLSQVASPTEQAVEKLRETQSADPNKQLISNAHLFQMAIEMYAVDHEGNYPRVETLLHDLAAYDYLENWELPRNPWSAYELHQSNVIHLQADKSPLNRVVDGKLSTVGTLLGPGTVPYNSVHELTSYGALIYDYEPKSRRYHLYAIGQQGSNAVVKGAFCNY